MSTRTREYYSLTSLNLTECVLVLHLCHKLEYFKKQKWEVPWIQDTHNIVRHKFDRSYAPVDVQGQRLDKQIANISSVSLTNPHV